METTGVKRCTECAVVKPVEEFNKSKANKDGYQGKCRACNAAYHAANRAHNAARYADNRVAVLARVAAQSAKPENRERKAAYNVAYYAKNRDTLLARQGRRGAAYHQARPEISRNKAQLRRARKAGNGVSNVTAEDLRRILQDPCAYCGGEAEHVDHVVPLAKGGPHSVENLAPACAPCNLSKGAKLLSVWRQQHHN